MPEHLSECKKCGWQRYEVDCYCTRISFVKQTPLEEAQRYLDELKEDHSYWRDRDRPERVKTYDSRFAFIADVLKQLEGGGEKNA